MEVSGSMGFLYGTMFSNPSKKYAYLFLSNACQRPITSYFNFFSNDAYFHLHKNSGNHYGLDDGQHLSHSLG